MVMRENFVSQYPMFFIYRYLHGQFKDEFLKYLFGDLEYQFEIMSDLIAPTSPYLSGCFTFAKDIKLKVNTA